MTKGHYTPRKKKKLSGPTLCGKTKLIRIDHRTEIEVPVSMSNDVAIERYYQRHKDAVRPSDALRRPLTEDECEAPQEELQAVLVNDDNLPDD
jgi:hypothetical protein